MTQRPSSLYEENLCISLVNGVAFNVTFFICACIPVIEIPQSSDYYCVLLCVASRLYSFVLISDRIRELLDIVNDIMQIPAKFALTLHKPSIPVANALQFVIHRWNTLSLNCLS